MADTADVDTRDAPGFTQETLRVRADLQAAKRPAARYKLGPFTIDLVEGRDSAWLKITKPEAGGIALRTVFGPGPIRLKSIETSADGITFAAETEAGEWRCAVTGLGEALMRATICLTPALDLLIPFWPRDLYVFDQNNDPLGARGNVEAAQRGLNTGLCYFCTSDPDFGSVLYLQNLTALNPYFMATKTTPDGVVGGEWPELGYQPPASPDGNSPPTDPLKAGVEYVISDVFLSFRHECARDEMGSARRFLDMIADIYPHLDRPMPEFHDWVDRARKTLKDLKTAPAATLKHYGHTYLHPYVATEYPDSMVQMSVAAALDEVELLFGTPEPFKTLLMAGMGRFYDKDLGTIRRYLPNVGDDKNADAVDSWYLYHPLMNLGRLAIRGDKKAGTLFLKSLDYAVKAARHFKYQWPIQFNIKDFSVIVETRGNGYGQTDVAGLYAYVMIQAHQFTGHRRYVEEAKAAMKAAEGMRFELVYQANLTAWGIAACIKLWRQEEDERYLAQAEVFLASFVHNSELWESQIGHARHYSNFFGVTCLHDASYMAAYECFESFSAFDEVLHLAAEDLPHKVKLLLSEFRRFAFDRSWFYYPDTLPEEAVAKDNIRNGYIDRNLSFPMEDLYGDGRPAGQVGQEIYGCGGSFILAARGFYERDIPFRLFMDYPYSVVLNDASIQVTIKGPADYEASIRLLKKDDMPLPDISASIIGPKPVNLRIKKAEGGSAHVKAPANGIIRLVW